jgi:phage regulator Rha-like protein
MDFSAVEARAVAHMMNKNNQVVPVEAHSVFDLSMSSREIAEVTGKAHKHVKRDIEVLIEQGVINGSNFGLNEYKVKVGFGYRTEEEYILDHDATMTLVTGYDAKRRMAVVKRWRELEQGVATPVATPTQYQIPQTYIEALEAHLADQKVIVEMSEKNTQVSYERDEAVRTKAWISEKREATAMGTASAAVKKAKRTERELSKTKKKDELRKEYRVFTNKSMQSQCVHCRGFIGTGRPAHGIPGGQVDGVKLPWRNVVHSRCYEEHLSVGYIRSLFR